VNTVPLHERLAAFPPALLLGWGGVMKLLDPLAFQLAVFDFQTVPFSTAALVAAYLPWIEIATAISLLFRVLPFAGLSIATSLYLMFVILLAQSLASGRNIECGCLGIASLPSEMMLKIDLLMLLISAYLWMRQARRESSPPIAKNLFQGQKEP
jgi:hypothetical protein